MQYATSADRRQGNSLFRLFTGRFTGSGLKWECTWRRTWQARNPSAGLKEEPQSIGWQWTLTSELIPYGDVNKRWTKCSCSFCCSLHQNQKRRWKSRTRYQDFGFLPELCSFDLETESLQEAKDSAQVFFVSGCSSKWKCRDLRFSLQVTSPVKHLSIKKHFLNPHPPQLAAKNNSFF